MLIVLECVPKQLAQEIQERLTIPTIGIGAGVECDGQVLVFHDVTKYGVDRTPKFVKSYVDINDHDFIWFVFLCYGSKEWTSFLRNSIVFP